MNILQDFDITKMPPIQKQIDREKDELKPVEEKARKTIYFKPFTIIFFAWMFATTHAVFPGLGIAVCLIGTTQIISLIAADRKQTTIKTAMQRLEPIYPDHCTNMIHWCETYEEIRAYQNKVADLGRPLTEGEYQATLNWTKLSQGQAGHPSAYHRLLKRIQTTA